MGLTQGKPPGHLHVTSEWENVNDGLFLHRETQEQLLRVMRTHVENLLLFAFPPIMQMHDDPRMTHKRLLGRCELERAGVTLTEYRHDSLWVCKNLE